MDKYDYEIEYKIAGVRKISKIRQDAGWASAGKLKNPVYSAGNRIVAVRGGMTKEIASLRV